LNAEIPFVTRRAASAMAVVLLLLMVATAINFHFPTLWHAAKTMTDFDAFYVAGLMFWDGRLNDAYHFQTLLEAQHRFTGTESFMPWTYPPPFNLVTAALASLPIGPAYMLFIATSFLFYVVVLWRIAGVHTATILIAIFPAVILNIRSGQNGFLTGALLGLFLLSFVRRSWGGGVALGCMIFKPHLAVGGAILAVIDWRWRRIAASALPVVALLALSAAVFGMGIFSAFLVGVKEAEWFLAHGYYPLFRMTSVYAALYTAGAPPGVALALHAAIALIACVAIAAVAIRCADRRLVASLAAFGSLLISPYAYDYDLTILGIAAAFLWPRLIVRVRPAVLIGLIALCWVCCGWGLFLSSLGELRAERTSVLLGEQSPLSISGFALLALLAAVVATLGRQPFTVRQPSSIDPALESDVVSSR